MALQQIRSYKYLNDPSRNRHAPHVPRIQNIFTPGIVEAIAKWDRDEAIREYFCKYGQ